jgi:phosphohistidine phosphatase SixA
MWKFISIRYLIIFLLFISPVKANEEEKFFDLLKSNDKIIWLRHFSSPGGGDPDNFDVRVRSTQRNIGKFGIKQGKAYSKLFKKNKVNIKHALSSQWFRAMETCQFFKEFKTFSALNSTFSSQFSHNTAKQRRQLREYIKKWNGDGNLLLCSHYVILSEHLNYGASEGEIVLTDKNLKILAKYRLKIKN